MQPVPLEEQAAWDRTTGACPHAKRLPPDATEAKPHGQVEDRQDEAELEPVRLRHVASAKVRRRRADAVGGEAAHEIGQLRQRQRGHHCGRATRCRDRQERRVHGANVCGAGCKEVVRVEVEQHDDGKRRLPCQAQLADDVNHRTPPAHTQHTGLSIDDLAAAVKALGGARASAHVQPAGRAWTGMRTRSEAGWTGVDRHARGRWPAVEAVDTASLPPYQHLVDACPPPCPAPRRHRTHVQTRTFPRTMAMRAANHESVSHAGPLARHSFHVTTLVMSRMARPTMAAATALMPKLPPKIHSATVTMNAPAVIFSFRDSGPSFSSSFFAAVGASGVSFTSGG
eukprot:365594-Chlamydomonas_euryale.AAC.5